MRMILLVTTCITCFFILAGCAVVQQAIPWLTLSDSNIVGVLNSIGEAEVEAAELARLKATAPEIQAFAGRLLNEHRQLEDDQARLAQQLQLVAHQPALASTLKAAHEKMMQDLREKSGQAFDEAYVRYEIDRHSRAFSLLEAAAESEDNLLLRQQLVRTGPDLLSHLSAARALQRHLVAEQAEIREP